MPQNADQIRIAPGGAIYVANPGTVAPADETVAMGVGWYDLGFASEKGANWKDKKTSKKIGVWQSAYPGRIVPSSREGSLEFDLMQWNRATLNLAQGGGTHSTVSTGHFKYQPPAASNIDYRMMCLEWVDGNFTYRLICTKGLVTSGIDTTLVRDDAAMIPITYEYLGQATGVDPWYLLTNDPSVVS